MATYDAGSAATAVFATAATARVAQAARSLSVIGFVGAGIGNVTYTSKASAAMTFATDANAIRGRAYNASAPAEMNFISEVRPVRSTYGASESTWSMSATADICTAGLGLQVIDGINAIFSVWGASCHTSGCNSDIGEEAVNCLNAAFQRLASSGRYFEFINSVTRRIDLSGSLHGVADAYKYPIQVGRDVQTVCAPVSLLDTTPLIPARPSVVTMTVLTTQFDFFSVIFTSPPSVDGLGQDYETTSTSADLQFIVDELNATPEFYNYWIATINFDAGAGNTAILTFTALENSANYSGFYAYDSMLNGNAEFVVVDTAPGLAADTPEVIHSRKLLRPLATGANLRSFEQRSSSTDAPLCYCVENSIDAPGEGINGPLTPGTHITLAPRPTLNSVNTILLEYDAVLRPVRFSCQTPYERLPVPHLYAETILLPLAKYYATSSRFFQGKAEIKEAITAQAKEVLTILGDVTPEPKEAK